MLIVSGFSATTAHYRRQSGFFLWGVHPIYKSEQWRHLYFGLAAFLGERSGIPECLVESGMKT
jgi:hypothetical protein